MWSFEKRLQYPVNIKKRDLRAAQIIISQYGGLNTNRGYALEVRSAPLLILSFFLVL